MFAGLVFPLLLTIGSAGAAAQPPREMFDPNDPTKLRKVVSRAEREKLGLDEQTWTGVVHPGVFQAFVNLKVKPEDPIERDTVESRIRFEGAVYVQVHLQHTTVGPIDSSENKAAIAEVQHRVLRSLTAAEFHPLQLFKTAPGLIGFASQEAITKLSKNPDVVGVCLDDKPMPEQLPVIYESQLPPARPGEEATGSDVGKGKVTANVYRALAQSDRVMVIVGLRPKGDPLPMLSHVRSEYQAKWEAREKAVRELQDRVLSTVTADDFWLWSRLGGSPALAGYINREGLETVLENDEVTGVGLDQLESLPHV